MMKVCSLNEKHAYKLFKKYWFFKKITHLALQSLIIDLIKEETLKMNLNLITNNMLTLYTKNKSLIRKENLRATWNESTLKWSMEV
jgi:hypothetical protein